MKNLNWRPFAVLGAALALFPSPAPAGDFAEPLDTPGLEDSGRNWLFELRPYLWTASIDGDASLPGIPVVAPVDIGFDDILDDLDFTFAATLNFEHQHSPWSVFADLFYLRMSPDVPTIPGPIQFRSLIIKQYMGDLSVGYRVVDTEKGWLDLTAGVRWTKMDLDLNVASGPIADRSVDEDWFDPHIGMRGKRYLNEKWYCGGIADIGGFGVGADLAAQVGGGVGYHVNPSFTLELMYRYLYVDYENDGFLWDTSTNGIFLGTVFRW